MTTVLAIAVGLGAVTALVQQLRIMDLRRSLDMLRTSHKAITERNEALGAQVVRLESIMAERDRQLADARGRLSPAELQEAGRTSGRIP